MSGRDWPGMEWAGIILAILVLAFCAFVSGCKAAPEPGIHPSAEELAKEARCVPLAPCPIPPGANSEQLEAALLACLLEYRGLYAYCAAKRDLVP